MVTSNEQWRDMLGRSFSPLQWFATGEDSGPDYDQPEGTKMWVHRRIDGSNEIAYEVGYFDPKGSWHVDSTWPTVQEARAQVNFLNGGNSPSPEMQAAARRGFTATGMPHG